MKIEKRKFTLTVPCIVIMVALFLAVYLCGATAETAQVSTGGGTLNVRKEAADKSKVVTKLKNGTLIRVDEIGDTWCHVIVDGKSGYVKRQYLKLSADAVNKTVYTEEGSVFLRESPDNSSGIVAAVNSRDALNVLSVADGWALVAFNGISGYIPYEKIASQNETPVVPAEPVNEQAVIAEEQKVYKQPDTHSEVLDIVSKGSYVIVSRVDDTWSLISLNGQYGYILSKSVQLSGADVVNPDAGLRNISDYVAVYYTGSASGQILNLFTAPTADTNHVWKTVTLKSGETFKVLQRAKEYEGNIWSRVWLQDGTVGWILSSEANIGNIPETYHYANPISRGASAVAYVNDGGATIFAEASSLSDAIGSIPAEAEIEVFVGESFSEVSYQGKSGWVSNARITFGFAISGKWQEEASAPGDKPSETEKPSGDDTDYISLKEAKQKAAAALKKAFKDFRESSLESAAELSDFRYGIQGPLYYIVYSDKKGNYWYGVMIDARTGETLYTADYTSFSSSASDDTPATRKPKATSTPIPDYPISKSEAKRISDSALSSTYGDFSSASFSTVQIRAYAKKSNYGGPLWQVDYYIGDECAFQCLVHCETGEILYKNDTWDAGLTEIDYSEPTPTPVKETGSYIGKDNARSIADRYLSKKYPRFNDCSFSDVVTRFIEEENMYFDTPYYQFDYYVDDIFVFEVIVHAITGEIEYSSGSMPGEGNG